MADNKRLWVLLGVLILMGGGLGIYWLTRPALDEIPIQSSQMPPRGRAAERENATMAVSFAFPRPFDIERVVVETVEPVDYDEATNQAKTKVMWEMVRDPEQAEEYKPVKAVRYGGRMRGFKPSHGQRWGHHLDAGVDYRFIVEGEGLKGEKVFQVQPFTPK